MRASCPDPIRDANDRCAHCGRPVVDSEQFGRLVHKRGRWREALGLDPLHPLKAPKARKRKRDDAPARPDVVTIEEEPGRPHDRCPDCHAMMQELGRGVVACPWTSSARRMAAPPGSVLGCLRPYKDMEKRTA